MMLGCLLTSLTLACRLGALPMLRDCLQHDSSGYNMTLVMIVQTSPDRVAISLRPQLNHEQAIGQLISQDNPSTQAKVLQSKICV